MWGDLPQHESPKNGNSQKFVYVLEQKFIQDQLRVSKVFLQVTVVHNAGSPALESTGQTAQG